MVYYNEDGSVTSNAAPRTLIGDNAIIAAKDAEIARLTAERDEWERQAIYHNRKHGEMLTAFRAAEAERDEARAQVAMAFGASARLLDPEVERPADYDRNKKTAYDAGYYDARKSDAAVVRALTPAYATAALAARDAAMRNEGRRQAAEIARDDAKSETGVILNRRLAGIGVPVAASARRRQAMRTALRILASLEPEGGE